MKAKIIIIGGGFSGIAAAKFLSKHTKQFDITLIDRKDATDFLPLLPDAASGKIKPALLSFSLNVLAKEYCFDFIKNEVTQVLLTQNRIKTLEEELSYDYLLIASGTEPNFYGREDIKKYSYSLNKVNDAIKINEAILSPKYKNIIIAGAGYTGVELACAIKVFFKRAGLDKNVFIVEKANSTLGPLPEDIKNFINKSLGDLNIKVFFNSAVEAVSDEKVTISNTPVFNNAMLIWSAGVKTSDFINKIAEVSKNPQGRIKVDDYLRINDNCFVAGDASQFLFKESILRMAVQFAIFQGFFAGQNIIRSFNKKPLKKFKPVDLGYIVPMANNKSCGKVFGINVKNNLATALHYIMCIYRTYGFSNKYGIIKNIFSKRR